MRRTSTPRIPTQLTSRIPLSRKRHRYDRATSQVAARALEARLRADVHHQRTNPQTVAQLLDRWLDWAEHVRALAPTTLVGYRHYAQRILTPRLGHLPVTQITTGHLEELYAQLRRSGAVRGTPLAASTVRSIHSVGQLRLHPRGGVGLDHQQPRPSSHPAPEPCDGSVSNAFTALDRVTALDLV
jgi:hypothetical protein